MVLSWPKTIVMWIALGVVMATSSFAFADGRAAKQHFERARAAFALGDYAKAATEFESAYALKPAAGLLFDAAQAHRLAGNKTRARLLYENYYRLYGQRVNGAEDISTYLAKLDDVPDATPAMPSARPSRTDLKFPFDNDDDPPSRFRRVKAHYDLFKRSYGLVLEDQWTALAMEITTAKGDWLVKFNQRVDTLERDMTALEARSPRTD